jgi:hypothetical protein
MKHLVPLEFIQTRTLRFPWLRRVLGQPLVEAHMPFPPNPWKIVQFAHNHMLRDGETEATLHLLDGRKALLRVTPLTPKAPE